MVNCLDKESEMFADTIIDDVNVGHALTDAQIDFVAGGQAKPPGPNSPKPEGPPGPVGTPTDNGPHIPGPYEPPAPSGPTIRIPF